MAKLDELAGGWRRAGQGGGPGSTRRPADRLREVPGRRRGRLLHQRPPRRLAGGRRQWQPPRSPSTTSTTSPTSTRRPHVLFVGYHYQLFAQRHGLKKTKSVIAKVKLPTGVVVAFRLSGPAARASRQVIRLPADQADPQAEDDGSVLKAMLHRIDRRTGRFVRLKPNDRHFYLSVMVKVNWRTDSAQATRPRSFVTTPSAVPKCGNESYPSPGKKFEMVNCYIPLIAGQPDKPVHPDRRCGPVSFAPHARSGASRPAPRQPRRREEAGRAGGEGEEGET